MVNKLTILSPIISIAMYKNNIKSREKNTVQICSMSATSSNEWLIDE